MLSSLLSDAIPTWTNKEVLTAVGSAVATAIGAVSAIAWIIVQLLTSGSQEKIRKAEQRVAQLESELTRSRDVIAHGNPELTAQLESAHLQTQKLQTENAHVQEKYKKLYGNAQTLQLNVKRRLEAEAVRLAQLMKNLGDAEKAAADRQEELAAEQRRIQQALKKDGYTWSARVLASVPDFKPLEQEGRRTPIISILNLKGGVGKTTITANLGSALDQLGHRVLLVDLDLQGSLTGLYLPETQQAQLDHNDKLLDDFLAKSFDAEFPNILDFTQNILPDQKSGLVPTSDALAYEESKLTIRWMLREGNRDPRFLLRKELHMKRVTSCYDIMLLDCPPMLNICCVNAIAASDYLLIPILPSEQATARVPVLIERFKQFRENINPSLKILGIIINRTYGSELTVDEADRLQRLQGSCRDRLGESVPQFSTFIRQTAEVRRAEDEHRTLVATDGSFSMFIDLAKEVESRLPTFARQHFAEQAPLEVAQ